MGYPSINDWFEGKIPNNIFSNKYINYLEKYPTYKSFVKGKVSNDTSVVIFPCFVYDENSVLSLFINRSIKTEIPLSEHKYLILFFILSHLFSNLSC